VNMREADEIERSRGGAIDGINRGPTQIGGQLDLAAPGVFQWQRADMETDDTQRVLYVQRFRSKQGRSSCIRSR
jgi:hypothetical protein